MTLMDLAHNIVAWKAVLTLRIKWLTTDLIMQVVFIVTWLILPWFLADAASGTLVWQILCLCLVFFIWRDIKKTNGL